MTSLLRMLATTNRRSQPGAVGGVSNRRSFVDVFVAGDYVVGLVSIRW
jgi:hypothetical protein